MTPAAARRPHAPSRRATRPRTRSSTPRARRWPTAASTALTMDAIARRAFVSRTAVYFYFPNKRAVVDRLIQQAFSDMYLAAVAVPRRRAASPRRELRRALARVVAVVNRNAHVLLLAASSPAPGRAPAARVGALRHALRRAAPQARIARDQQRGIAPPTSRRGSRAQALLAMVERHSCASSARARRRQRSRSACWPSCGGARCTRGPPTPRASVAAGPRAGLRLAGLLAHAPARSEAAPAWSVSPWATTEHDDDERGEVEQPLARRRCPRPGPGARRSSWPPPWGRTRP